VIGSLLLGGLITTYILAPLGLAAGSIVGAIIVAFIGAVLLLAILRLVSGAGRGSYRRRRWL